MVGSVGCSLIMVQLPISCLRVSVLISPCPLLSYPPPVVINLADGRTSVTAHSVSLDLAVGTLQSQVDCIPTVLAHYDVVLGKPWLTLFNPGINWKLNVVSLVHCDV